MEVLWPAATDSISLSPDQLDVWAVRLDRERAPPDDWLACLSEVERQRAEQFRLDPPRRRFIMTRTALRTLLAKYLGTSAGAVPLEIDSNGKPRLGGTFGASDLRFNVAHSDALALIAITTDCEVGADVERVRSVSHAEHIARRYFHPAETEAILAVAAPARDAMFLRCWTGKEAVLKAVGSGVTGSLASFRVPTNDFNSAWIQLPSTLSKNYSRCWLHELAPCQEYVGAVASLGHERRLRCFAFEL